MIIGITGRAQSGKDTLARALQITCYTTSPLYGVPVEEIHGIGAPAGVPRILHFADALRDVVEAVFGSRYETGEEKAAVDQWWQEHIGRPGSTFPQYDPNQGIFDGQSITGRLILQKVGTELFRDRVHPDFWLFALERRMAKYKADHYVIADVRFDNEAQWVKSKGGFVIGLERVGQTAPTDSHASERGVSHEHVHMTYRCSSVDEVQSIGANLARLHLGA